MAKFNLKEYARRGAEVRVAELNEELKAIYAAFPDLRESTKTGAAKGTRQRRRKRSKMSAAARKAVGVRMKKYWAGRRKASAK